MATAVKRLRTIAIFVCMSLVLLGVLLELEPSRAPVYLMLVGLVVGVVAEFLALYVTRKNHTHGHTVTETGRS